jgi:hypothetical protein
MRSTQVKGAVLHFKTVVQSNVPQGRNGKHKLIVTTILKDLDGLKAGSALKVPLAELVDSKEKVRSALIGQLAKRDVRLRPPPTPTSYTCGT